jgi:hypothetical protein
MKPCKHKNKNTQMGVQSPNKKKKTPQWFGEFQTP